MTFCGSADTLLKQWLGHNSELIKEKHLKLPSDLSLKENDIYFPRICERK